MGSFVLVLSIILFAASAMYYSAASLVGHGNGLIDDVCRLSGPLCFHPEWLAFAGAIGLFVALFMRLYATIRG